MLVVLALLLTMAALTLAGYSALTQAAALNTAAAALGDLLAEGRQDAVTDNLTVEVRFYDLPGPVPTPPVFRTVQLHWLKPDGTTPAIDAPLFLPNLVVADATAAHSTLLSAANPDAATPDSTDRLLDGNTRVFRFLPDGSIDLDPAKSWFLTLRAATRSDPAHFPSDWACLTVDPATGRVQMYRP